MSTKDYFTFTSSQKKGVFAFVIILLTATVITLSLNVYQSSEAELLTLKEPSFTEPVYKKRNQNRLDINLADSAELASLKGIGPILAKRIINFRESRNGFSYVGQLQQVYGLSNDVYRDIEPYLFVSPITAPSFNPEIASTRSNILQKNEIPLVIDINLASAEDFEKLPGIGKILSQRIINYRNSIKGFETVDELKAVYRLEEEVIAQNREYLVVDSLTLDQIRNIELPDQQESKGLLAIKKGLEKNEEEKQPVIPENLDGQGRPRGQDPETSEKDAASYQPLNLTNLIIDINTADSARLTQIRGIGEVFARRIVNYRKVIGFFSSTDDLIEIYGIDSTGLAQIKQYTTVGELSSFPRKDLNFISKRNLAKYPSIDTPTAKIIIDTRKKLGRFDSWEEVAEIEALTPTMLAKLKIYFFL
jgi:DNA uptake protein ComE-like DNA-binding protein